MDILACSLKLDLVGKEEIRGHVTYGTGRVQDKMWLLILWLEGKSLPAPKQMTEDFTLETNEVSTPRNCFKHILWVDFKDLFKTVTALHEGKDYRLRKTIQKIRYFFEGK